jgi:glycosyltransferase involved in cell wall biosynthesis
VADLTSSPTDAAAPQPPQADTGRAAATTAVSTRGRMTVPPTVSVIIPAHNEASAIAAVVAAAIASDPRILEVMVVDDGSSDDTATVAFAAGARVLQMPHNRGKGRAMQYGIRAARGDVLVFIDADGQDDPAEIPLLLDGLTPDTDMVIGSRFTGYFRPGAITRVNRVGTQLLTFSVRILFGAHTTDCLAGFRAVRRSALDRIRLRANGYDIEVDMLLRILRSGGRVVDVPVSRSPRPFGNSGLSNVKDGARILARILLVRVVG